MRRGLAELILGVSLLLASLTWAGFVTTHTVLDPNQSERLADQVLDNETLRSALVGRLADSLAAALPDGATVPQQTLESIAATALDDPSVERLVRDGIVKTHQNALNGVSEPVLLDGSALSTAVRTALVGDRPELDSLVPEAPAVAFELPTTGLSWFGKMRNAIERLVIIGFLLASAGAIFSLVVAKNRAAILRRVSFWAFGASAFWLAVSYLVPYLAEQVGPTSTAIASAMTDVLFGAMVRPAIIMAAFGTLLLGFSFLIGIAQQRGPAKVLQPTRPAAVAPAQRPAAQRTPSIAGQVSNVRRPNPARTVPPNQARQSGPVDQTAVYQQPSEQPPRAYPGTAAAPAAQPVRPAQAPAEPIVAPQEPRWVEGVGYVDEP
ncbi:MAG: hypothetical protein R2706_00985 [Acidimicrobiales bacterium]